MSKKTSRVAASFCVVAIAGGGAGAAAVALTHDSSSKTVTVAARARGVECRGGHDADRRPDREGFLARRRRDRRDLERVRLPVPGQRRLGLVRRGNRVRLRPEGRHRHERPRRRRRELDLGQVPGRLDLQGDGRRRGPFERPGGHPRQRARVEAAPSLQLGDSSTVAVGDGVVAIGNPFGLDNTVTSGIVSALNREITSPDDSPIEGAIQTDAAINHGNSGGPLFNLAGQGDRHQLADPERLRR